jgi:replicative DNA helicase
MNKFEEYDHYFEGEQMTKFEVSIITKNLPSPNEAFGSDFNNSDDDSDVPF